MLALSLILSLALQVDQTRIDGAVRKGVEYIKTAKTPGVSFAKIDDSFELVLLTLVSTGLTESDPVVSGMVKVTCVTLLL